MSYESIILQNQEWVGAVFEKLEKKLCRISEKSRNKIPYSTFGGVHDNMADERVSWWTNGFFGGLMWLMYEATGKECYKTTAKAQELLLDGAWEQPEKLHHDVGFQWNILSGASYRLTGDKLSLQRLKRAAEMLYNRYNEKGEYIVAWNGDKVRGWSIIDSMMNIPLLYRASEIFGDEKYKDVAIRHANMAMRDHVRPDGSVNHIVNHYIDKVGVVEALGGQGYGVGSCWSRGAAWALYGFALSYIHTEDSRYIDTAKKVAHYFISALSVSDFLPLTDFRAPSEPVVYDSTASAIASAGLIELARLVPEYEKDLYLSAAIKSLKALEENFCDFTDDEDGILMNGMELYIKEPKNIIYGDYYFTEAILKLHGSEFLAW